MRDHNILLKYFKFFLNFLSSYRNKYCFIYISPLYFYILGKMMFLDYFKISMIFYANHMILERKFLIVEIVLKSTFEYFYNFHYIILIRINLILFIFYISNLNIS